MTTLEDALRGAGRELAMSVLQTKRASHTMIDLISQVLRRLLPPGSVVDLATSNLPAFMKGVQAEPRSAIGSRYTISGDLWVTLNPHELLASEWRVQAYPLDSEGRILSAPGQDAVDARVFLSGPLLGRNQTEALRPLEQSLDQLLQTLKAADPHLLMEPRALPKQHRMVLVDDLENLIAASEAVIHRWDSPLWKVETHTAEYIHCLRQAVKRLPAIEKPQPSSSMQTDSDQGLF